MLYWFTPTYPLDLIYNILNYLTTIFIIGAVGIKFKTEKKIFILLILTSAMPLLINGPFMPWYALSDQSKYLRNTMILRDFDTCLGDCYVRGEEEKDTRIHMVLSAYLWALSPMPFIENYNSIGLINRLYLSLMIIFIATQKNSKFFIYFLILSPSLLLYSSAALRESFIVITTMLTFYCLLKKRYYLLWLPLLFLLFTKIQNGVLVLLMSLAYLYIYTIHSRISKSSKLKYSTNILIIVTATILFIAYGPILLNAINIFANSFGVEAARNSLDAKGSLGIVVYGNFFEVIIKLPIKLLAFFISPFPEIVSPIKAVFFLENLFIILLLIINFIRLYKKHLQQFYYWFICFIMFSSMYALTVVNHGTISRYKLSYVVPFLFVLFYLNSKKYNEKTN
jgi:hypothetical protein